LRRIEAGINPCSPYATLTRPFFIGIFEMTQRQYELVTGTRPSHFTNLTYYATRPVEKVSYNMIRGASRGAEWPTSSDVDDTSFLGKLRIKVGMNGLDLPTYAQWEYAGRAGTTTFYNSGKNRINSSDEDANMDEVGRYFHNGGYDNSCSCTTEGGTAAVGSYKPNAWGIYDIHGNVQEWCLDWFGGVHDGIDPVGPAHGNGRGLRGGSWNSSAGTCGISGWAGDSPSHKYAQYGFRLVSTLPETGKEQSLGTLCSGKSGVERIDLESGTRLYTTSVNETIRYSPGWVDGMALDVTAVVAVNGKTLNSATDSGAIMWMPASNGTFILTHKVMSGGEQIGETLTATFLVEGLCPATPVFSPVNGTIFDEMLLVSISCPTEGATIHYTTDGSEPTVESPLYQYFHINGKTTVKAIAELDGLLSDVATAEYALGQCVDPVIAPADGLTFGWEGEEVSVSWHNEDGVLRYTTDGSEPTRESPVFEQPFRIYDSTIVKAKVFSDDFFDSSVVTARFERNSAPIITGVTVQQRHPWNGMVEISYTVRGDIAEDANQRASVSALKVLAIDVVANTTNTATQLSGDLSLEEGTHTIVWDIDTDGVSFKSSNVVFKVSCETIPATYCVIDLSGGASASSYPVSYLSSPPSGGFNVDEYKTSKLVLKRLEAGAFKMGGSYDVTLTKPYFCGLFEMTQKQYSLVTGSNPSNFSGDKRPVEKVSYNVIRGQSNGAKWPVSSAVDSSSFMGKLRTRTGLDIDLPTEAQWEYACRAGTTMTYSYGSSADENYMWCSANSGSQTHDVGMKLPNPWGLYDMHGNVRELCLDWYNSSLTGGVVDPKGASLGTNRVRRGGSWYDDAGGCTSSFRRDFAPSKANDSIGFRLVWNQPYAESSYPSVLCYGESKIEHFAHTATTPEPVPYSYFNVNCPTLLAEYGGDYESAALATAKNGHNKVWECYVAGISPTNATASFKVKIEMKDGGPVVTWEPDLNTNGVVRTYKVYGSETLDNGGEWQYPTNSLHRFFKVTVEMP